MTPTEEQKAIFEYVGSGKGNLIVEALAGSGKTSTILQSLSYLPQKSAMLCAFNKRIAEELLARMPKAPKGSFWKAQTFHAIGLHAIQSQKGIKLKLEKNDATEKLVNNAAKDIIEEAKLNGQELKINFSIRRSAVKLLRTLKETQIIQRVSVATATTIGFDYDLFTKLDPKDVPHVASVAAVAYANGSDLSKITGIDFCDMTWLPVVLDLPMPNRYQAVFVDEAQDLSLPQLRLVQKLVAPGGRLFAIGDRNQQIYSWRGAVGSQVWTEMREQFGAESLPLTTTFRCARSIVELAQDIVPGLRSRDDAPDGSVTGMGFEGLVDELIVHEEGPDSVFVLSRNNADLLQTALHLWKSKVNFQLAAGDEIAEPLYDIIDKLDKSSGARFRASLMTWYRAEMARAEAAHASAWADRIEQQFGMLMVMLSYAEPSAFKQVLADLLTNGCASIVLSTVHKAKGLEADRVYLLRQTFARYQPGRKRAISQEDLNLEYVAITRARHDLTWVNMPDNMDVLTRVLDHQTRDDRSKGGAIGALAQRTFDGRLAIAGVDGTSAIVDPGNINRLLEGVLDEEEAARKLGLWPLADDGDASEDP